MKSCVVTGSSAGIGKSICSVLLAEGWIVVGVDIEAGGQLEQDDRFFSVIGDVATPDTARHAADVAESLAPLFGWVNNAGIETVQRAHEIDLARAEREVQVNLWGTVWGCAAAVAAFRAGDHGGSIVNVGSIQSLFSESGAFIYAATKGAVDALTRQLAVEYASIGVRANCVLPGAIDTELNRRQFEAEQNSRLARQAEVLLSPMARLGQPEEVAEAVAWLLTDRASFVTGHSLVVDGGAAVQLRRGATDSISDRSK